MCAEVDAHRLSLEVVRRHITTLADEAISEEILETFGDSDHSVCVVCAVCVADQLLPSLFISESPDSRFVVCMEASFFFKKSTSVSIGSA